MTGQGSPYTDANIHFYPYWTDATGTRAPFYSASGGNSHFDYRTNANPSHLATLSFTVGPSAGQVLTIWTVATNKGTVATLTVHLPGSVADYADTRPPATQPVFSKYLISLPASTDTATVTLANSTSGTDVGGQPAIAVIAAAVYPADFTPKPMPATTLSQIVEPCVTLACPAVTITKTLALTDDLQSAVNAASDASNTTHTLILLPQGYRWTGNCILPHRPNNSWVTIQSAASQSLISLGVRIAPTDFGTGPNQIDVQLTTNNGEAVFWNNLRGAAANTPGRIANNYRFRGLEITKAPGFTAESYALFRFAVTDTNFDGTTIADPRYRPTNTIIDHCYLHGHNGTGDFANAGIASSGQYLIVQDSWLENFHSTYREANAFVTLSAQHFSLINDFLESCGENVMHGGSGPDTPLIIPAFATYRFNYFRKRLSWNNVDGGTAGDSCIEKNLFEMKNGQDFLIDSNVLENSPVGGQGGNTFQLSPTSALGGGAANTIQRVTVSNNIVKHAISLGEAVGQDSTGYPEHYNPASKLIVVNHLTYRNNFAFDLSASNWGYNQKGRITVFCIGFNGDAFIQDFPGPYSTVLDHNSCFMDDTPETGPGGPYRIALYGNAANESALGGGYFALEHNSDVQWTYNYFGAMPVADGQSNPPGGVVHAGFPYLPSQPTWSSPAAVVDHNCIMQPYASGLGDAAAMAKLVKSNSTNTTVAATCPAGTGAPASLLDREFAIKSGNRPAMPDFPQ